MHEFLPAEKPGIDPVIEFTAIRDLRVGEHQRLLFNIHSSIGIVHPVIAIHQHDLKIASPAISNWFRIAPDKRIYGKHIEMPYLVPEIIRDRVEFFYIKFFYRCLGEIRKGEKLDTRSVLVLVF